MDTGIETGQPAGAGSPVPVGDRVWLMATGRSGRVVARAQGGLLYRVRLEGGAGTEIAVCPEGDLLRLTDEVTLAG